MNDEKPKYDSFRGTNVPKESVKRKLEETDIALVKAAKKPKIWSISEIIG